MCVCFNSFFAFWHRNTSLLQVSPVWPLTPDVKAFFSTELPLTTDYSLVRTNLELDVKISATRAWHTTDHPQPCSPQSKLPSFSGSICIAASCLQRIYLTECIDSPPCDWLTLNVTSSCKFHPIKWPVCVSSRRECYRYREPTEMERNHWSSTMRGRSASSVSSVCWNSCWDVWEDKYPHQTVYFHPSTGQSWHDLISHLTKFTIPLHFRLVLVLLPPKFFIRESNVVNSDERFNDTFTV